MSTQGQTSRPSLPVSASESRNPYQTPQTSKKLDQQDLLASHTAKRPSYYHNVSLHVTISGKLCSGFGSWDHLTEHDTFQQQEHAIQNSDSEPRPALPRRRIFSAPVATIPFGDIPISEGQSATGHVPYPDLSPTIERQKTSPQSYLDATRTSRSPASPSPTCSSKPRKSYASISPGSTSPGDPRRPPSTPKSSSGDLHREIFTLPLGADGSAGRSSSISRSPSNASPEGLFSLSPGVCSPYSVETPSSTSTSSLGHLHKRLSLDPSVDVISPLQGLRNSHSSAVTDSSNGDPCDASFCKETHLEALRAKQLGDDVLDDSAATHFHFFNQNPTLEFPELSNSMYALLKTTVTVSNKTPTSGFQYLLEIPALQGYFKVGITQKLVSRRRQLDDCEYYAMAYVKGPECAMGQRILFYKRLEDLIHLDLWNERVRCWCSHGKHTTEWFRISRVDVMEVVKKWRGWMEKNPYGVDGKLKEVWRDWLDVCESRRRFVEADGESSDRWRTFLAGPPTGAD